MSKERKGVAFVLDKVIVDRLKTLSAETYIPQAKIVALALDEYMKKMEEK